MRKTSLDLTLFNFHLNMNSDIDLLMKVETSKRVIRTPEEKKSIFEAFVLRICALWEELVEELLIGCLNQNTSQFVLTTGFKLPPGSPQFMTTMARITGLSATVKKQLDNEKRIKQQKRLEELQVSTLQGGVR